MSFISAEDIGIQAVSHSRMKTHESCPRKAKYKFIDKLKEPGSPAMDRGLEIHKGLEEWCKFMLGREHDIDASTKIPSNGVYRTIREDLRALNKGQDKYKVEPELQVAFNKDWKIVDWFAPDTWMRVVFDFVAVSQCGNHMVLGDYKTGKVYDDHDDQADLYAVAGYYMGAASVDVKFYYVDQNTIQPYEYDRDELEALVAEIEARAEKVTSDRIFPTNPSWRCKYCHFRAENGGPCPH
jgi:CRISPR/Cas system-associated exonuclease Cas4 (RecB family)